MEDNVSTYQEREITSPVDLSMSDGTLNSSAVGWSRRPLQLDNLQGRWFSKKRTNYWAFTTETHFFSVAFKNQDYFGSLAVQLGDFNSKEIISKYIVTPLGRGVHMSSTVEGLVQFCRSGVKAYQYHMGDQVEITIDIDDFQAAPLYAKFELAYPKNHETLNVVIPWNKRTFQYTSKHNTIPTKGVVRIGNKEVIFDGEQSFGYLDYGRGIWPRKFIWNWGAASGRQNGRLIGLNLGGKWTDGTNMNENGICVDGRITKISEDLIWEYDPKDFMKPWHISAPKTGIVDLEFIPKLERAGALRLGFYYKFVPFQIFGHYRGMILTESGERIQIEDLIGWAEEVYGRW